MFLNVIGSQRMSISYFIKPSALYPINPFYHEKLRTIAGVKKKKKPKNYQSSGNSLTHVVIDRNEKTFSPRTVKSDKNRPNGRV